MPVYEYKIDGTVYEIDAPDPDAMLKIASTIPRNTPVTEETPAPSGLMDKIGRVGEASKVFVNDAANMASFGLSGMAQRHGGAINNMVRSRMDDDPANDGMTYSDFLAKVGKEMGQDRAEHPAASFLGEITGAVAPVVKAGSVVEKSLMAGEDTYKALRPLLHNRAGRIGGAAALGAAQNLGNEAGRGTLTGDNLASEALLGAGGGAIGQGLGEIIAPAARAVGGRFSSKQKKRIGQQEASESWFSKKTGPRNIGTIVGRGQPITPEKLQSMADLAVGGKMFGETDIELLRYMEGLTRQEGNVGRMSELADVARGRIAEIDRDLPNMLLDNLTDSRRTALGPDAAEAAVRKRQEAGAVFRDIFDTPQARTQPVTTAEEMHEGMLSMTQPDGSPVFDVANMTGTQRRAMQGVFGELSALGGETGEITLKGLQNMKFEVDDWLASAVRGDQSSADKMAMRELLSVKKYVNDLMAEADPRYIETAKHFGEGAEYDKLTDVGNKYMGTSATKTSPLEITDYMNTLSLDERGAVQDGALKWLEGKIADNPNYLKKLAKEDSAVFQKVKAIFGDAIDSQSTSAKDLAETIDKALEYRKEYTSILKNIEDSPRAAGVKLGKEESKAGLFSTIAAIVSKGAIGDVVSGSFWSPVRRLLAGNPDETSQVALEVLTRNSPDTVKGLLSELDYMRTAPSAGLGWGAMGQGIAGATDNINQHPVLGY